MQYTNETSNAHNGNMREYLKKRKRVQQKNTKKRGMARKEKFL